MITSAVLIHKSKGKALPRPPCRPDKAHIAQSARRRFNSAARSHRGRY